MDEVVALGVCTHQQILRDYLLSVLKLSAKHEFSIRTITEAILTLRFH